jgi:diguanylate cyclase (GGDEF)-like protein
MRLAREPDGRQGRALGCRSRRGPRGALSRSGHFKHINDTLGHPIGDELLKQVGQWLRDCVRKSDLVARMGGDELAILQVGATQPMAATTLAARIVDVLSEPYRINGHNVTAGTSIDIAVAPADGTNPDQLIKNADMALYLAKADGRGVYRFF